MMMAAAIMLITLPTMATTPSQKAALACQGRALVLRPTSATETIPRISPRIGRKNAPSTPTMERMNAVVVRPLAVPVEAGDAWRSSGDATPCGAGVPAIAGAPPVIRLTFGGLPGGARRYTACGAR